MRAFFYSHYAITLLQLNYKLQAGATFAPFYLGKFELFICLILFNFEHNYSKTRVGIVFETKVEIFLTL
jgi:hypothetical protein